MSVISTFLQLYGLFQVSFVIPEPHTLPATTKQAALHFKQLLKSRLNFVLHVLTLLACLLHRHVPAPSALTSQDQT